MKRLLQVFAEKWPEYLLEVAVISLGILGGFILNTAKENYASQNKQRVIVSNLKEEFETNLKSLDRQVERLTRKMESCEQLSSYLHPSREIPDSVAVEELITSLFDVPTWNPSTFVLTDLRNTGELKNLQNDSLKHLLHQWEQHYENLKEWYMLQIDVLDTSFDYFRENGVLRPVIFGNTLGPTAFDIKNRELIRRVDFENLLMQHMLIAGALLDMYHSETKELIKLIIEESSS